MPSYFLLPASLLCFVFRVTIVCVFLCLFWHGRFKQRSERITKANAGALPSSTYVKLQGFVVGSQFISLFVERSVLKRLSSVSHEKGEDLFIVLSFFGTSTPVRVADVSLITCGSPGTGRVGVLVRVSLCLSRKEPVFCVDSLASAVFDSCLSPECLSGVITTRL
ncbi:unnamed protein product [Ectocarpus sp. 12 AP-2014]